MMKNNNEGSYQEFKDAMRDIDNHIDKNGISKENLAYLIEETEGMIADLEAWKKREAAKKEAVKQ